MITDTKKILNVNVAGIPTFVKSFPYWVNWKSEMDADGKKAKKVPTIGHRNLFGSYYDTEGRKFWEALRTMPDVGGLILLLSMNNELACIDIDDCSVDDVRFHKILNLVPDAWCEYSPSGHGIHVWGYLPNKQSYLLEGRKTIGYHGKQYEWYGSGRGITVTGHHICGSSWINLTPAVRFVEGTRPPKVEERKYVIVPVEVPVQDILDKAFAREPELASMYYSGHRWNDESVEDFRFCQRMWFWLGGHGASAIENVFRKSALYREGKGSHYVTLTVVNAGKRWNGKYYGKFTR